MELRFSWERLRGAIMVLYSILLVSSAWIHDDAYITFRSVDNFVHGLGPTWNPAERVQAYTHPLWMLIHAALYSLTREIYFTSLVFSMGLSLAVFHLLVFRLASSPWAGCAAGFFLVASKSFVEYSTSGLENPLTHLLFAVFALHLCREERPEADFRKSFRLSLVASLGVTNRPDTLLLFCPALAYLVWRGRSWRNLMAGALGFVPFLLWEAFSLIYYGFLLPNTAYAKLGIGVSRSVALQQGVHYFQYSLLYDPVTLSILGFALWAAASRKRDRAPVLLLAGSGLYLAYVLWIGGDYMGGRFLSAPVLGAAMALALMRLDEPTRKQVVSGLAVASLLLLRTATAPLTESRLERRGVGNERQRFYHATGLLNAAVSDRAWPDHFFRAKGEYVRRYGPRVVVDAYVGLLGFYAGPDVHVVDLLGLPDPLLARLPGRFRKGAAGVWTPGHVSRPIPNGYLESLASGENRIADADLARFYDKILRVTRGELWDRQRWIDIWNLHSGGYGNLVRAYVEANPGAFIGAPEDLRTHFTVDERAVLENAESLRR